MDRPSTLSAAMSPLDMMEATARLAAEDAGLATSALSQVETLVVVNSVGPMIVDNPPAVLARRLGVPGCDQRLTVTGGNTPQMLVNFYADAIASGKTSFVLLSGAEALDTMRKAQKSGVTLDWSEQTFGKPLRQNDHRVGSSASEKAHGMVAPIITYPLFENALRRHYGRSFEDHQQLLGELFAPYTEIAAKNPYAWFPTRRSAPEISEVAPENRYIGFPYTKYLNAVMQVNQGASILMTSERKAQELGIDPSRWVYICGCADVHDIWHVSERRDFHSSPAFRAAADLALEMANVTVDEIDIFDLYSCFPAIVQIAQDALGLRRDDPRPLTVTGGLPYFGGAGNNYSMHAIATMAHRLRVEPGSMGMVAANGWYVTKHALGIYSTTRPKRDFASADVGAAQHRIDAMAHPVAADDPSGAGKVETYTVLFGRNGEPERGLVIGRLNEGGRFVAFTPPDPAVLNQMVLEDPIGRPGRITPNGETNSFEFTD